MNFGFQARRREKMAVEISQRLEEEEGRRREEKLVLIEHMCYARPCYKHLHCKCVYRLETLSFHVPDDKMEA